MLQRESRNPFLMLTWHYFGSILTYFLNVLFLLNEPFFHRHVVHSAPVAKVYHTPIVPAVSVVKTAPIIHGKYLH